MKTDDEAFLTLFLLSMLKCVSKLYQIKIQFHLEEIFIDFEKLEMLETLRTVHIRLIK
jgi:hypothetical protein